MRLLVVLLTCWLALAGCGSDDRPPAAGPNQLDVTTAFYPLAFLTERIGGPAVEVTTLASPGIEPHDLELTARQVAGLSEADLVVYLSGFQPAVDDAVAQQADNALDVATVAPLTDGDPHVWLDPIRFAAIADALAARLAQIDPDRAADYTARAAALRAELAELDADFTAGLANCQQRVLVSSHDAFGYLATAYDLRQLSLTGLSPQAQATPATLARVARMAQDLGVRTVFFSPLLGPDLAQTLAAEIGAQTRELSPLESPPQSGDYLSQMRTNLASLQSGLGCSPV